MNTKSNKMNENNEILQSKQVNNQFQIKIYINELKQEINSFLKE